MGDVSLAMASNRCMSRIVSAFAVIESIAGYFWSVQPPGYTGGQSLARPH